MISCQPLRFLSYPEQENAPAKTFLKIGACPSAYKKKLDEAIVKAIFDDLLIFKFETFVKAEFIFKYLNKLIIGKFKNLYASKDTKFY